MPEWPRKKVSGPIEMMATRNPAAHATRAWPNSWSAVFKKRKKENHSHQVQPPVHGHPHDVGEGEQEPLNRKGNQPEYGHQLDCHFEFRLDIQKSAVGLGGAGLAAGSGRGVERST